MGQGDRQRSKGRGGAVWLLLLAAGLALGAAPAARADGEPAVAAPAAVAERAEAGAADALGIRVTALRLSAGGFMVDLRYRVTEPERAKQILDKNVVAYLEDEASGARFAVPATAKLGKLRQGTKSRVRMDRDYAMLFANPGGFLQPGAKVMLVAGGVRVANLTVQ